MTGSWGWSLFAPSIFFFLTGSAAYVLWGSADQQDFSEEAAAKPFAVEEWARGLLPRRAGNADDGTTKED
jgi:hypothetical protein